MISSWNTIHRACSQALSEDALHALETKVTSLSPSYSILGTRAGEIPACMRLDERVLDPQTTTAVRVPLASHVVRSRHCVNENERAREPCSVSGRVAQVGRSSLKASRMLVWRSASLKAGPDIQ
jgi:hypothetical protein